MVLGDGREQRRGAPPDAPSSGRGLGGERGVGWGDGGTGSGSIRDQEEWGSPRDSPLLTLRTCDRTYDVSDAPSLPMQAAAVYKAMFEEDGSYPATYQVGGV